MTFLNHFLSLRNLKNRAPVETKRLFSQNRRFRFKSKHRSKKHRFFDPQTIKKSIRIDVKNVSDIDTFFDIDFSRFLAPTWLPNLEVKPSKIELFDQLGLTWASLVQKGVPRRPKSIRMRPKGPPGTPT